MKKFLPFLLVFLTAACDYNIVGPSVTNSNTSTNTNTNSNDSHDGFTASAATPVGPTTDTPLNIPTNSETVARSAVDLVALGRSCQDTYGESAWVFMDAIVTKLKATDSRWGYLIKTSGVASRDVIAYRATSDNIGAWGVDIIQDHCGAPKFSWNVIGYDEAAHWSASR